MGNVHTEVRTDTAFLGYLALGIYCGHTILSHTDLQARLGTPLFRLIWLAMMACLILRVVLDDKHSVPQLLVWILIFPLLLLLVRQTENNQILLQMSLVLLLYGIPFRGLVKCIVASVSFWMGVVVLCCAAGILQNYEFNHGTALEPWIAQSLGFKYYSYPAYLVMAVTFGWLYLRGRKVRYTELLAIAVLHWVFYRYVHTARLVVMGVWVFLLLQLLLVKTGSGLLKAGIWRWFAALFPTACFAGTWILVWLYGSSRQLFDLLEKHFLTLALRLRYSVSALHEYGLHLLGNRLYLQGHSYLDYNTTTAGIYLDSNYVYLLLVYGILFSAVVLVLLSVTYMYIHALQDTVLYLWFGIMLVLSVFNNFLVNPIFNPGFLLAAALLSEGWPGRRGQEAAAGNPAA